MSQDADDFLDIVAHLKYQEVMSLPDREWFWWKARGMAAKLIAAGFKA